jgi:hypothetical protein
MELSPSIEQVKLHRISIYTKKKIMLKIITTLNKLTKDKLGQTQNNLT